jgi:hypothetical protein
MYGTVMPWSVVVVAIWADAGGFAGLYAVNVPVVTLL